MPKANRKPEPPASGGETMPRPPFDERCRARSMWSINEAAECLVPPPQNCEYVLASGERFYCHHPRREEIVLRTLKLIQSAAS